MKISILITSILFSISSCFASSSDIDKVYTKLKQKEEVFSMSLSKDITDFFDMDVDYNGKEKWITGDFTKGNMLVVKTPGTAEEIKRMFLDENYKLVEIEDDIKKDMDEDEVFLFVDHKGPNVSEAHFVVMGEENLVVLTVYGDIKVKNKK